MSVDDRPTRNEAGNELSRSRRIATGTDSRVYRAGDLVIKEYTGLDLATLIKYQQMTNAVAQSLIDDPIIGSKPVMVGVEPWKVTFQVTPITEVPDGKRPQATSMYVPGPNGFSMLGYTKTIPRGIHELEDKEEEKVLLELARDVKSDPEKRQEFAAATSGWEVVKRTKELTGVENLNMLQRVNTKIRADVLQKQIRVIVTDLGAYIGNLKFRD